MIFWVFGRLKCHPLDIGVPRMSMPLPMDFDLEIVLLAGGRDLKLELEDLKIIKHEAFGGVWAVLNNFDMHVCFFLDLFEDFVLGNEVSNNFASFFWGRVLGRVGSRFFCHLCQEWKLKWKVDFREV